MGPLTTPTIADEEPQRFDNPSRCSLAIGIPLTLDDLTHQWTMSGVHEFAAKIVGGILGVHNPIDAWHGGYEKLCEEVMKLVEDVRQRGVHVVERASLADIGQLLQSHDVVSLIAHGPYHNLRPNDVRDFDCFHSVLRQARERCLQELHPVVNRLLSHPGILNARNKGMLIRELNPFFQKAGQFFHDQHKKDEVTWAHLWEAFPEGFASPVIIELSDGFHTLEEMVGAVPTEFQGTIHFVACSALWFSESIRRLRPRIGDIACPRGLLEIDTSMRIYRSTIEQIALRPSTYKHALFLVHQALLGLLDEPPSEGESNA